MKKILFENIKTAFLTSLMTQFLCLASESEAGNRTLWGNCEEPGLVCFVETLLHVELMISTQVLLSA